MKEELGNSRLLYKQSTLENFDLFRDVKLVDEFIELNPKLMRSNKEKFIYFFSSSSKENFVSLPIWIGREIVGYCSSDSLDDSGLYIKDFNQENINTFPGPNDLSFDTIFKNELAIRAVNNFAETWRVKIDVYNVPCASLQFWE